VSGGVIILRRTRPNLPRAFRAPLVPLLPIASVCACIWLMVNLTVITFVDLQRCHLCLDRGRGAR